MAKNNRKCYTCGKAYYYCPTCTPKEPSYKVMHCSETCKAIWSILVKNGTGKLSAQEAMEALFHYELPLELNENVQQHIDRIVKEVTSAAQDEVIEDVVETVDTDIDDKDE